MSASALVLVLSLLGTGQMGGTAACASDAAEAGVIEGHVARYPGMRMGDLYKLLHQGALGSEHAVPSVDAARAWFDDELASMGDGPAEPLLDTIAPAGTHVRVHLRPFMERGGDPNALLSAFVATANGGTGSQEALICALETSLTLAHGGRLPWSEQELARYLEDRRAEGYPAIHHSEEFTSAFRPAYRVVAGDLIAEVLGSVR